MLDKILDELVRKGNKKQERHFQANVRALNANLAVLTTAGDALLAARRDGLEPFGAVFDAVGGESLLAATVESSKKLIRPLDLDSRDLIQTQYAFVRGALLALYDAREFRAVRGSDPALDALDYTQRLNARGRRVNVRRTRISGQPGGGPDWSRHGALASTGVRRAQGDQRQHVRGRGLRGAEQRASLGRPVCGR
jgi:hypothetical protein